MSEPTLCNVCDKELSKAKGELEHGCLDCHGQPYSDKLFFARKRITHLESVIKDMGVGLEFYDTQGKGWLNSYPLNKQDDDSNYAGLYPHGDTEILQEGSDSCNLFSGKRARETLLKHKELLDQLTAQAEKGRE